MIDDIYVGVAPVEENCVQLGSENYYEEAMKELKRYRELLRLKFGNEPEGAELRIKRNEHDFGTYYDIVCVYDDSIPEAINYCFTIEHNLPLKWDDVGKVEIDNSIAEEYNKEFKGVE